MVDMQWCDFPHTRAQVTYRDHAIAIARCIRVCQSLIRQNPMTNTASRTAPSHELHGHSAYREPIISRVARRFTTKCNCDVFSVTIVWQSSRSTFVLFGSPELSRCRILYR